MEKSKNLFTAFLCFFISVCVFAQTGYTVGGIVIDKSGVSVYGATVMEEGTHTGTVTDNNGKFKLTVSGRNATVSVSSIGYKTVKVKASEYPAAGVVLEDDNEFIEDAVVVGYGTVKREDLTGSITAIKAEEINRGAVTTAKDLLQGKVPGMLVLSDGTIRIRGISSLNASNVPLIVVDGIPLNSNGLSAINPDDIESFSVLKDASSAAIYGSRAASGVIMVTTKKAGASVKAKVAYRGSASIRHYIGKLQVMNAGELRSYMDNLYQGNTWATQTIDRLMGDYDTDWIDKVTRLGQSSTHNLSIAGTVLKGHLPYRAYLGLMQMNGTSLGSSSVSPNLSLTLSPTFLDDHLKLTFDAKLNTRISSNQSASYSAAADFDPSQPVYFYNADGTIKSSFNDGYFVRGSFNSDGSFTPSAEAETNPMQYNTDNYTNHNLGYIVSGVINYKVHGLEDLSFNLRASADGRMSNSRTQSKSSYWGLITDAYAPGVGTYTTSSFNSTNEMLEFFGNYQHEFGDHNISAMAGYSWQHFGNQNANGRYYSDDCLGADGKTSYKKDQAATTPFSRYEEHFLVSFYGRLNYSYKSRYLLTGTLRYDGSSRFAPKTRWGLFPSLAAAWNIKQEPFMKGNKFFSELKLRYGWGVTGQESGIANYSYIPNYTMETESGWFVYSYNMGSDGRMTALTPQAYDPNTKWEETTTENIGLDFGIFGGVLSGNIDLYKRTTKDLLNQVKIPMGANFSNTLLTKIGSMENKGLELGITATPISNKDISLVIGANVTFQNTRFTQLTTGNAKANKDYAIQSNWAEYDTAYTGGYISQHKVGYAPGVYVLYQQIRDENGKAIQNAVVDRNDDGIITEDDRYITGKSPLPTSFYGLNMKFTFKNWDLGLNGHGSTGNWVFSKYLLENSTPANTWLNYDQIHNYHKIVTATGWKSDHTNEQIYSDNWLYDGSFFKIDDINLGYTFNNVFKWCKNIRVALSANNVLLLKKYPGVDPEDVNEFGVNDNAIPLIRTYTLRVNVNF